MCLSKCYCGTICRDNTESCSNSTRNPCLIRVSLSTFCNHQRPLSGVVSLANFVWPTSAVRSGMSILLSRWAGEGKVQGGVRARGGLGEVEGRVRLGRGEIEGKAGWGRGEDGDSALWRWLDPNHGHHNKFGDHMFLFCFTSTVKFT